jgi:hypothetical protein
MSRPHKFDEWHICVACGHSEGWVEKWKVFECVPEVSTAPEEENWPTPLNQCAYCGEPCEGEYCSEEHAEHRSML